MPRAHSIAWAEAVACEPIKLQHFNILVGPNNAGKSTVLAAFRILATAIKRATARKPEAVDGPDGPVIGYRVDMTSISVAEENIFYNYDDSKSASVSFKLSNGNELILFFRSSGSCVLIARSEKPVISPVTFSKYFNCPIGFVPILGPVEHNERLYAEETAERALSNYTASRHFRNIWHYYPQKFDNFRNTLMATWPGMDVTPPVMEHVDGKPRLFMFCPEERIPRELCWAGFGFQVWCQMLTHLVQGGEAALFLIDEPDIYLHSDLQRQLVSILRNLGPDIVIATHSTEIVSEAESNDIVLIDKRRTAAQRIKDPSQLIDVFSILGSNLNPILTQLAKTKRAVFVEGKDFQILGRFAKKLGFPIVANRGGFAVVPVEGFNPQRMKNLKAGMEVTLGCDVYAIAVLDRDFRCESERQSISDECKKYCTDVTIHQCKEIENFLLVPDAIDRVAAAKVTERSKRSGTPREYVRCAEKLLDQFATDKRDYVQAQTLFFWKKYQKEIGEKKHEATMNEAAIKEFNKSWLTFESRMMVVPGKEALSFLNQSLQSQYSITVSMGGIVDAMRVSEVPVEMQTLINSLQSFANADT